MGRSSSGIGFLSNVLFKDGTMAASIVTRFPHMDEHTAPLYGIKPDLNAPTHWITNRGNNEVAAGRIKFKSNATGQWVDPTDLANSKRQQITRKFVKI